MIHNESEDQTSVVCLDDDCNVGIVDVDGDGVPDYILLNIRWAITSISALASIIFYKMM